MRFSIVEEAWISVARGMPQSEKIRTAWVDSLLEVGTPVLVKAGEPIIIIGDQNTSSGFLLVEGEYSILKGNSPEMFKAAPELLGEMGRINPIHKRTATVRASTEVKMVSFDWDKIHTALHKRLNESEFEQLTESLKQYAWGHFTE